MDEHERLTFIERNGYDPTTIEGVTKHIDDLRVKVAAYSEPYNGTGEIGRAMAAMSIEQALQNAYAVLGRLVYDERSASAAQDVTR